MINRIVDKLIVQEYSGATNRKLTFIETIVKHLYNHRINKEIKAYKDVLENDSELIEKLANYKFKLADNKDHKFKASVIIHAVLKHKPEINYEAQMESGRDVVAQFNILKLDLESQIKSPDQRQVKKPRPNDGLSNTGIEMHDVSSSIDFD